MMKTMRSSGRVHHRNAPALGSPRPGDCGCAAASEPNEFAETARFQGLSFLRQLLFAPNALCTAHGEDQGGARHRQVQLVEFPRGELAGVAGVMPTLVIGSLISGRSPNSDPSGCRRRHGT